MYVEAVIQKVEFRRLLESVLPLTIDISEDDEAPRTRYAEILKPDDLAFLPGEGVSMTMPMRFRWPVPLVSKPFEIRKVTGLLLPFVNDREGDPRLIFELKIEDIDIKYFPDILDRAIVRRINEELDKNRARIGWDFGDTLSVSIWLPDDLEPTSAMNLKFEKGKAKITDDALHLRAPMGINLSPVPETATVVGDPPETRRLEE